MGKLFLSKWADKELSKLPEDVHERVLRSLRKYRDEDRGDVKPIGHGIKRLRVGDYRAFIKEAWVLKVQHRGKGYTPELIDTLIDRYEKLESAR